MSLHTHHLPLFVFVFTQTTPESGQWPSRHTHIPNNQDRGQSLLPAHNNKSPPNAPSPCKKNGTERGTLAEAAYHLRTASPPHSTAESSSASPSAGPSARECVVRMMMFERPVPASAQTGRRGGAKRRVFHRCSGVRAGVRTWFPE